MFDARGRPTSETLAKARLRPQANWIQFGGIQMNADLASAWYMGLVQGF
jgi:hypothetical protein